MAIRRKNPFFPIVFWLLIEWFESLAITKLDIFDELKQIKVAVSYSLDGKEYTDTPPGSTTVFSLIILFNLCLLTANASDLARVTVKYITFEGWQSSIANIRKFGELPTNAQNYIKTIEKLVEVPGIALFHYVFIE